jgi:ABC-type sugar transport system permease subunit
VTGRHPGEERLGWLLCAPAVIAMLLVTAYPITFGMFLAVPASCAACSKIYYQKTMRWRIY